MPRKSGKDGMVEVELGATYFPMQALTSVTSPASDVNKKFTTGQTYISPIEDYEPDVRLDGVVSGLILTPSASVDAVDYSAGKVYIKGVEITVAASTVSSISRPAVDGNVIQNAIVVDENGTVTAVAGVEGTTSNTRGAAGGPPFLPLDQVLLGYVILAYVAATGGAIITANEVDTASKERADIPGYKILYHDGQDERNPNGSNEGCIEFTSALDLIHNSLDDPTGASGDAVTRNLYASWRTPVFEEIPDCMDVTKGESLATINTLAYGDTYEEKATSTPAWTANFSYYWSKVNDIIDVIKNTKRFFKLYPNKDSAQHWLGVCTITANHSIPVADALQGDVTMEGSGAVFTKTA
jgi:hypothetical protein